MSELILVVDDEPKVMRIARDYLEKNGFRVVTAADGQSALTVARSEKPDLVILDLMLPGRSGFLALEKIKGREDSPLVIMVTANEGRRHQAYAESLGVDRYLLKPVPLQRLLDTAAQLVEAQGGDDEDGDDGDDN